MLINKRLQIGINLPQELHQDLLLPISPLLYKNTVWRNFALYN